MSDHGCPQWILQVASEGQKLDGLSYGMAPALQSVSRRSGSLTGRSQVLDDDEADTADNELRHLRRRIDDGRREDRESDRTGRVEGEGDSGEAAAPGGMERTEAEKGEQRRQWCRETKGVGERVKEKIKGRVVEFARPKAKAGKKTAPGQVSTKGKTEGPPPPPTDPNKAWESQVDPYVLARVFLTAKGRSAKGELALRLSATGVLALRGWRVRSVAEDTIRTGLTTEIKRYFDQTPVVNDFGQLLQVTANRVTNALNALRSLTAVDERTDQPVWVGPGEKRRFVSFTNGLVDLDQLLAGKGSWNRTAPSGSPRHSSPSRSMRRRLVPDGSSSWRRYWKGTGSALR